jgi:hypothetical protein
MDSYDTTRQNNDCHNHRTLTDVSEDCRTADDVYIYVFFANGDVVPHCVVQ